MPPRPTAGSIRRSGNGSSAGCRRTAADAEERRFVEAELAKPADLDAIVREATTPELAIQVYAASLLAIEVDTPAERSYLRTLADRLGLPREAIQRPRARPSTSRRAG